jgi:hypothetical protein
MDNERAGVGDRDMACQPVDDLSGNPEPGSAQPLELGVAGLVSRPVLQPLRWTGLLSVFSTYPT